MKRKLIAVVMLCSVLFLPTACKKNAATTTKTTSQQLKDLDAITKKGGAIVHSAGHNTAAKPPNPYGTMVSDGIGALGGAFLGPFGAFCGAVCTSINYSFGFGWDSPVISPTPISSNSNNPYDNYGAMHNNTCSYILSIDNSLTAPSSILSHVKLYGQSNWSTILTGTAPNPAITNIVNIIMTNGTNNNLNIESTLTAMVNAGYVTPDEYNVEDVYFNTFVTSTDPVAYSIAAEAIVNSSLDLSPTSKMKILVSMAVTRNSFVFWQAQ